MFRTTRSPLRKPTSPAVTSAELYNSELREVLQKGQKVVADFKHEVVSVAEAPHFHVVEEHQYVAIAGVRLTWEAARTQALALSHVFVGAWDLATITTLAEQQLINKQLGLGGQTGRGGEFWLGAEQPSGEKGKDSGWQWVTGEKWDFENWSPGEPNDYFGPASEQRLGEWGGIGTWNDEGNLGNITGFIAEGVVTRLVQD
jgi:hypothetical protein